MNRLAILFSSAVGVFAVVLFFLYMRRQLFQPCRLVMYRSQPFIKGNIGKTRQ